MTIVELIKTLERRFKAASLHYGHSTDNAWDEACFLVLSVCDLPPNSDRSVANRTVSTLQIERIEQLAARRIRDRTPLPYLLGHTFFAGLRIKTDARALVPRSPFGPLLKKRLRPYVSASHPIKRILDLCTGGGSIAIAAAHYFPEAHIDASDISSEALALAQENVDAYHLDMRIRLIQSDLFSNLKGPYDLILSNPPYVDANDMRSLPQEYRHEPALGLAAGVDGLDIVRHILWQAPRFLTPKGILMVEVGNSYPALEKAFPKLPFRWLTVDAGEDGIFMLTREQLTLRKIKSI